MHASLPFIFTTGTMDASASSGSSQYSGKETTGATNSAVVAAGGTEGVEALTGHKAELKQTLSLWALLALSYSNMVGFSFSAAVPFAPALILFLFFSFLQSVWTAIGGSLTSVFTAGGPVVMVWSWVRELSS